MPPLELRQALRNSEASGLQSTHFPFHNYQAPLGVMISYPGMNPVFLYLVCFHFNLFPPPSGLEIEPRASHMLGKLSATEPPLRLFCRYRGNGGITFTS